MATDWQAIDQAFNQALELDTEARAVFFTNLGEQDPELAEAVLRLLAADEAGSDQLFALVADGARAWSEGEGGEDRWIGHQLGAFKILDRIATGGMGAVFLAERTDAQYQQQVAIKIMGAGQLGSDASARFRAERQILADLDHPYIAQLLDGGTTDDGLPYLVMEYIHGEPVDQFAARNELSVSDRLALFRKICEAVEYAHRNLVVHRDLKPNNILVDANGDPKLLDFGIAKLLDSTSAHHKVAVTREGVRAMTPEFASPEQVRGESISVASDVYALGVLLYRLLTGQSPYGNTETTTPQALELAICEGQPRKPSTAVTETDPSPTTLSISPERLRRQLSGDLDNIVLMALRKEPERRYGSVRQFSEDVGNYLENRPVQARRSSWSYRTAKFLRRHGIAVAAGMLVVATIVSLTSYYTLQLARERDLAQQERDTAEEVSDFVVDIFQLSDPSESRGNSITVREVLDRGAIRVSSKLESQPLIKARMSEVLGQVYHGLGLDAQAGKFAEQAVHLQQTHNAARPDLVADAQEVLANTYMSRSEFALAEVMYLEILETRRRVYGNEHADTLNTMANLGDLYWKTSRVDLASETCEAALPGARKIEDVAVKTWVMVCLGNATTELGDYETAAAVVREAADLQLAAWGADDPSYLSTLEALAAVYKYMNATSKATELYTTVLESRERILGPEHREVMYALINRGTHYQSIPDLPAAEADAVRALELSESLLHDKGYVRAYAFYLLGNVRGDQGHFEEAEEALMHVIEFTETEMERPNLLFAAASNSLANGYMQLARYDLAEQYSKIAMTEFEQIYSSNHPRVTNALAGLVSLYLTRGELQLAVDTVYELLAATESFGDQDQVVTAQILAVKVLSRADRPEEAVAMVADIRDEVAAYYGADSPHLGVLLASQASAEHSLGRYQSSIEHRLEAIALLSAGLGEEHPAVARARVGLGSSYLEVGKPDLAQSNIRQGYEMLLASFGAEHPYTVEAAGLLESL